MTPAVSSLYLQNLTLLITMPKPNAPMVPVIRRAARPLTADALLTLAQVMYDPAQSASARIKAANSLLEWGWGKPGPDTTVQQADDPDGDLYMDADLYSQLMHTMQKAMKLSQQVRDNLTGASAQAAGQIEHVATEPESIDEHAILPRLPAK